MKIAGGNNNQIQDRQMRISGDGLMLITLTGDSPFSQTNFALNFTTAAP
jgi:hypothetical protein